MGIEEIFDGHNKIMELYQQGKYKEAKKILRESQNKLNKYHDSIKKEKQQRKKYGQNEKLQN